MIKTASWFTELPNDHVRTGISRGVPRRQWSGYRMFRQRAPGPWFNSVGIEEYCLRYRAEVLDRLDPSQVIAKLQELAGGRIAVMVCFERPDGASWCHRAMAAEWLGSHLGTIVPEFGFEHLTQAEHPLMPKETEATRRRAL